MYSLLEKYGRGTFKNLVQNIKMVWYVKTNVALQKVMQLENAKPFYGMPADTEGSAPLSIQCMNEWNDMKVARVLLDKWDTRVDMPKIIKLRSAERNSIIALLASRKGENSSIYNMFINPLA